MNNPVKLLFDECMSRPSMRALLQFVLLSRNEIEFKHLTEFHEQGILDNEWIPQYSNTGWVIVSSDRNKGTSSKGGGGSLPRLCREFCMTHILLGTAVHRQSQFNKMRSLIIVWPEIVEACSGRKGTRYVVRMYNRTPKLECRDEETQEKRST